MKVLGKGPKTEEALEEATVPVMEFISIPQEAVELKKLLNQLAIACESKVGPNAKESVKAVGADIVRLLTGPVHGDRTNFEAIASVTRVLLYILDESEKRSMTVVNLLRELPAPKSIN